MQISVALATYNGAKHISAQLESLASQRHLPHEIVIGDDGSTDATLDIVEDFARHASFPVHVHRNETNLGYARNFLATAKRCRGDWVAFCDQDDVWLPNKLHDAASAIERAPGCTMVLQNAWLCDGDLSSRGRKFPNRIRAGIKGRLSQYGFWVWLGFLQTVSKEVISLWDGGHLPRNYFPDHREMSHDKWSCLIANALGGICVLGEPAALYRRHEGTVTGDYKQKSPSERLRKSLDVSSEHYDFLSSVAHECAEYLEQLAERAVNPSWSVAFQESACAFSKIERLQGVRAALYQERNVARRMSAFITIFREGGYIGAPFHAMGLRSAVKDVVRLSVGGK